MADPAPTDAAAMWDLMMEGSEELAEELDVKGAPGPRSLEALDRWVGAHDGALDEDELGRLGMFLCRVLLEAHDGGLMRVEVPGHALDGEWVATGFRRGLAHDYVVPFVISAARIGVDRTLSARTWYEQLRREGKR